MIDEPIRESAKSFAESLGKRLGRIQLHYTIRDRPDRPYLVFEVAKPTERLFKALKEARSETEIDSPFKERATISQRRSTPIDRISLPETQLLKATLSESLTVDRHTFGSDFFDRYIRSVFGHEDQIVSAANHLVYGRGGSGKSSLLAFAMHTCKVASAPFAWIDMQAYAGRGDTHVAVDVIAEVAKQLLEWSPGHDGLRTAVRSLEAIDQMPEEESGRALSKLLPKIKQAFAELSAARGTISIFLDDIHVVRRDQQASLLSRLYSTTRGARCYLKISGIEQFSKPWDNGKSIGLQTPHDAQVLKLDYNLTMPDKSLSHIRNILDAHARFCGIPNTEYLCGPAVLERLVWVAAAVPRDALSLFAQSIVKASAQGHRRVTVTSINAAASDMAEQKLRELQDELREDRTDLDRILEAIKDFCLIKKRKNAFLLEIKNTDDAFKRVQELVALRFVHVLHEGITPHEAGRRYQALMLDYGFYVGIRAAKSIEFVPTDLRVQQLRKLPILVIAPVTRPQPSRIAS